MAKLLENSSHTTETRAEELNKKGKVESVTESVERVTRRGGQTEREVIRYVRDGKDSTESEKKRRAEEKAKPPRKSRSVRIGATSPFEPTEQPKHRFTLVGTDPADPNRLTIRFEPKGKPSPETNVGEAVVDWATGAILRLRFHPSDNPTFVDRMDVQMEYGAATPEGPALSRVTMEGAGGILFIKKRMKMTVTLSDYAFGAAR
jgi:transcription elongation GreA/GreB family factor